MNLDRRRFLSSISMTAAGFFLPEEMRLPTHEIEGKQLFPDLDRESLRLLSPVLHWVPMLKQILGEMSENPQYSALIKKNSQKIIKRLLLIILTESKGNPQVNNSVTGAIGLMQCMPQLAVSYLVKVKGELPALAKLSESDRWSLGYEKSLDHIGNRAHDPTFWLRVGTWAYMQSYTIFDAQTHSDPHDKIAKDTAVHRLTMIMYNCGQVNQTLYKQTFGPLERITNPYPYSSHEREAFAQALRTCDWDENSEKLKTVLQNPALQANLRLAQLNLPFVKK